MINIVVALLDEARPLIEAFDLKQVHFDPFPIYIKDNIRLVLSKIGALSSACAVTTLHHLQQTTSKEIWLNIGLCGHETLDIGSAVLVTKVMHQDYKERYYPSILFETSLTKSSLKTLNYPSSNYEPNLLFDCEGFGFYQAASRYSTIERIHLFKVVSDHSKNPLEHFDRKKTQDLIENQISNIKEILEKLSSFYSPPLSCPDLDRVLLNWSFSQTERYWIQKHLPILQWHLPSFTIDSLKGLSSKAVMSMFKQKLKEIPL